MSGSACCTSCQAGLLVFNSKQSGRAMLMAWGEASKLSHCQAGHATVSVITYYGRRKCPSFIEAKIWPQLSFLLQPLLQRKNLSDFNSLLCHLYLFDLHSLHQSQRKIQIQALTEVLREYSTVDIQKAIPALEMSSTYFKIKVCKYIQSQNGSSNRQTLTMHLAFDVFLN